MSDLPKVSLRELMDAGVHYGHKTMRWNPKMAPYLYGSRNGIHIVDLQKTAPLLRRAMKVVSEVVANNGRVLFVGTKRQASQVIAEHANNCGQYYVNQRWLGGMLTNWKTVSASIKRLKEYEAVLEDEESGLNKKERLLLDRNKEKINRSLGGIRDMGGRPDLLFVVDTNKESLAIKEAKKLGIPVVAVIDSNSDPDDIDFPIPGNDDATRAIDLYCKLISDSVLSGIRAEMVKSGVDLGEQEVAPNDNGEKSPDADAAA